MSAPLPPHGPPSRSRSGLVLLGGPTASGKSEVAVALAELLDGEIVSVDSMQVYRGLDIGTAKPPAGVRARVPHHLMDVVDLSEPFDAARFVVLARRAVAEIHGRGRVAILCGGTGLYFRAFLAGLGEAPPPDPELRAELEATPLEELLRELQARDPATYERIDRRNPRRVVRAVEVIRLTGKPFSVQRADWREPPPEPVHVLRRAPEDLRRRIDARVDQMFAAGLVEETQRLLARGLEQNRTAMQALGYRQVVEHLRGHRSLPETIELVKRRTWQFARRQLTWFRRQPNVEWLDVSPQEPAAAIAARLAARARANHGSTP
ncbi:MAG: tRNA (adenosine(37)-N6)-dimethylallyltransferase MiaA [Verrucomicrobiae bacterium]|nr:tRNA (adenosine(37)-N6)-dimethylallyltransferase MiaA [Verrucomicrobiae bacterium]